MMLQLLDALSTLRFTGILGIESEGNAMARWFFSEFGMLAGNILFSVTVVPLTMGSALYLFYRIFDGGKLLWYIIWCVNIFQIITVIINYSAV